MDPAPCVWVTVSTGQMAHLSAHGAPGAVSGVLRAGVRCCALAASPPCAAPAWGACSALAAGQAELAGPIVCVLVCSMLT